MNMMIVILFILKLENKNNDQEKSVNVIVQRSIVR